MTCLKFGIVNVGGSSVKVVAVNATTGTIARYTKDGALEWSMEMPVGIVGVNVSYEEVWIANLGMEGQSSTWGYGCAVSSNGSTIALGTLGFVADGYVFVFNNYSGTPLWYVQTGDLQK